jgi:hypothetical protein
MEFLPAWPVWLAQSSDGGNVRRSDSRPVLFSVTACRRIPALATALDIFREAMALWPNFWSC